MNSTMQQTNGAQALVEILVRNRVEHVFCVPGESYLAVLDALRDSGVQITICRNEGGAVMAAEAVGKATGRPGVCFVTRAPGATNAAGGVFIAHQDSTPLILFVGQVERGVRGREAFQEMAYEPFFGSISKLVLEIDDANRIQECVMRAFSVAMNGRPGPVIVALPKDMLTEPARLTPAAAVEAVEISPGLDDMDRLSAMLATAERPILALGGSRWSEGAVADIKSFAEPARVCVVTSYRRLWLFDPLHPCYGGDVGLAPDPKLIARVRSADLVVAIGGRMGDIPSQGYKLLDIPVPQMPFVHVHPGAEELGRVYQAHLAIHASPIPFARALLGQSIDVSKRDVGFIEAAHRDYLQWSGAATPQPGAVNLGEAMVWLRENLPIDAIICNGAGNYAGWIHRFYRFRAFASHIAPTAATMGYGTPAAVAMKRLFPQRTVVCIAGDGDFLMNGQEFATAAQYELPIVFVVCDNASYGTIRMHQERDYPGRVCATDLRNPDFSAYARAFGGFGVRVSRTQDFPAAFEAARAANAPAIVHLDIDTRAIAPTISLDEIRDQSLARKA
jgi:acetolactate synthase I/II/III large subunit